MSYLRHSTELDVYEHSGDNDENNEKTDTQRIVERFFEYCPRERWTRRGISRSRITKVVSHNEKEEKSPALKRQKTTFSSTETKTTVAKTQTVKDEDARSSSSSSGSSSSTILFTDLNESMLLMIASFLDPHDMMDFFATCKATWKVTASSSNANYYWRIRLESVFGYFRFSKKYVDQLCKLEYDWKKVIQFFTFLANTMQKIYGPQYNVHPIHRFLVSKTILYELCCGVGVYYPSDDEDEEEEYFGGLLFHPKSKKQKLTEDLFFTRYSRFTWCVVMGDGYYSFSKSECQEYNDDNTSTNIIDFNAKENVLDNDSAGLIYVYMYQDEDNFETSGMTKLSMNNEELLFMTNDDSYKGLAHYYVMALRRYGIDSPPNARVWSQMILQRLWTLKMHNLLDNSDQLDWNRSELAKTEDNILNMMELDCLADPSTVSIV